jgi:hypothetical protein
MIPGVKVRICVYIRWLVVQQNRFLKQQASESISNRSKVHFINFAFVINKCTFAKDKAIIT